MIHFCQNGLPLQAIWLFRAKGFTTEIQNFRMLDTLFVTTSSQQIRSCSLHGFGDNAFLSVCTQQMQYTACSGNPEFL